MVSRFHPHGSSRRLLLAAILVASLSLWVGCGREPDNVAKQSGATATVPSIRVAVVDDPELGAAIEQQWKARSAGELTIQTLKAEQLDSMKQLLADVIIYPSACLGTLAERNLIAPLAEDAVHDPQYALRDVLLLERIREVRWGDSVMAVSFGSPQLVLIYRADLFKRLKCEVPSTWEEYQQVATALTREKLGDLAPPADRRWSAVVEPLADGWAGTVLLARAAPYASHPTQFSTLFDYTTMDPLIGGPPFVRALEELVAANGLDASSPELHTPETAKRSLYAGEAAMVLAWSSRAVASGESPPTIADGIQVGFAELPGAATVYNFAETEWTPRTGGIPPRVPLLSVAGRLGSVAKNARRPREAAEFLARIAGKSWSTLIAPQSRATTLFRQSQLRNPELWTDQGLTPEAARQYVEVVEATQSRPTHMPSLRIPGWQRYLKALDVAVHAARSGDRTAADALAEAVATWQKITEELGREAQRTAYTRSLGLDP
ncbi:MAG: extracellular solute-binding protein [Planctomycetes bacterium]|nr:extracellular solute-binding protein [Planctomycetota bacterium]